MPSELEDAILRFRGQLLRQEREAASAMVRVYGESWREVRSQITETVNEIQELEQSGEKVLFELEFRRDRSRIIRQQIEQEIARFVEFAESSTVAMQQQAMNMAGEHAEQAVQMALGLAPDGVDVSFVRLPRNAVEDLVGLASNGSPLRPLFASIAEGVADNVVDTLATGIALGWNPRTTADLVRHRFSVPLSRAMRIARTETLRAYREANLRNYRNNRDVVTGWIWVAALDTRTCASCWAMHGTSHDLDETLDDHPNGRCTPAPKTKSWRELGYDVPDRRPEIRTGAEVFENLEPEAKQAILGKAGYAAYAAGAVSLSDFVGRKRNRQWGTMRYQRSLRAILGEREAQRYYAD